MKKTIIQKVMAYIHDYDMDAESLKQYIERGLTPEQLVQDWFFACYYNQAFDAMREFYGDDFDEGRYYCKDGETLKYRHWTPYIWTQYCNHIALVLRKMLKN